MGPQRLLDLAVSLLGLLVLFPLFLVIAVLIKLDSPGPVFHRGVRVGKNGTHFRIFKFRSMVVNAAACGPGITRRHDSRITRVGRFLRRTKIDEIPQLINVVRGEMSLVGPRPEDPAYVAKYPSACLPLLSVRPGITGAASLAFRHEEELLEGDEWEATYINTVLPAKLQIELDYQEHRTVLSDIGLMVRTFFALFH